MRIEISIRTPGRSEAPVQASQQANQQAVQQAVRRDIQEAVRQVTGQVAQQGGPEAARAASEAASEAVGAARDAAAQAARTIRVERDGKLVTVGPEGVSVTAAPAAPLPPDVQVIPREAVVISIAFFIMVAIIVVGFPIARARARRLDRSTTAPQRPSHEQQGQLRRMEQALEAISVEVERISENQRFVTRLITEARPELALAPGGRDGSLAGQGQDEPAAAVRGRPR